MPTSENDVMPSDLRDTIKTSVLKHASDDLVLTGVDGNPTPRLFDFRAILLEPRWLDAYTELFWKRFESKLPFQVCAMESAGISLVSAIVMKSITRGTPVNGLYVRKSRKKHGLMKILEGTPTKDPVILVDDLINSGRTFEKQIKVLEEHGLAVSDLYALLAFRTIDAYQFASKRGIGITTEFTLGDFDLPLEQDPSPQPLGEAFEEVWRFRAPEPSHHIVAQKSAPVIDSERIYFGTDSGTFFALEQSTGAVAWSFEVVFHPTGKGILSSPALFDGRIFFGAYDGNVYALDTKSGKKLWEYIDADWVGSSPSIAPELGLLYIGLEFGLFGKRGGIAALDMKDGSLVWQHRTSQFTHGSPLYIKEEGVVVIGSNNWILYAHDAKTGEIRWEYPTGGDIKTKAAYDSKWRLIVCGSMDGNAYVLNARNGLPVYAKTTGAGIYSIPLIHDGVVYITSLDKHVYALDLDSFNERWKFQTNGRIFASPVLAEGSLWIGSNDGCLYELDPEKGTMRSYFQATERVVNSIAYNADTKCFFVPTCANELYCLKKRPVTPE